MRVRKAVIPAAGLGTRLLPATKAQAKEMLPLVDKPVIQYVVEEAVASGIEDIIIVTGRGKRAIEDYFDRNLELERALEDKNADLLATVRHVEDMADIHFIRQKQPLGLGHAIFQARKHVGDEPFAVLLPDEVFVGEPPCLQQLIAKQEETGGSVIAVRSVPEDEVSRYGVIEPEPVGPRLSRALHLVEKPSVSEAPSNLAIVGRYVLDPRLFDILADLPPGRNREIQLTDGLRELNRVSPVYAYEPVAQRYDVGDKLGYIVATIELALTRSELAEGLSTYLTEVMQRPRLVKASR